MSQKALLSLPSPSSVETWPLASLPPTSCTDECHGHRLRPVTMGGRDAKKILKPIQCWTRMPLCESWVGGLYTLIGEQSPASTGICRLQNSGAQWLSNTLHGGVVRREDWKGEGRFLQWCGACRSSRESLCPADTTSESPPRAGDTDAACVAITPSPGHIPADEALCTHQKIGDTHTPSSSHSTQGHLCDKQMSLNGHLLTMLMAMAVSVDLGSLEQ